MEMETNYAYCSLKVTVNARLGWSTIPMTNSQPTDHREWLHFMEKITDDVRPSPPEIIKYNPPRHEKKRTNSLHQQLVHRCP
eukprot:scaffold26338_cov177-Skeletonema_menzelii.AAC.1